MTAARQITDLGGHEGRSRNSNEPKHLPQFVGYREVQDALGVSRRTVERMVLDKKFPAPEQLSPNRVGWRVETLTAYP